VTSPNAARYGAFWRSLGISDTPSDVRADYRFDAPSQTLTVNRLEIAASGLSRLSLEGVLRNVRSLSPADAHQWTESVAIQSTKLQFEDQSALRRAVHAYAQQQGKSEAALVQEWAMGIALMTNGKGGRTAAAADALVSFLQDYQKPKGRLQVSLSPSKP